MVLPSLAHCFEAKFEKEARGRLDNVEGNSTGSLVRI